MMRGVLVVLLALLFASTGNEAAFSEPPNRVCSGRSSNFYFVGTQGRCWNDKINVYFSPYQQPSFHCDDDGWHLTDRMQCQTTANLINSDRRYDGPAILCPFGEFAGLTWDSQEDCIEGSEKLEALFECMATDTCTTFSTTETTTISTTTSTTTMVPPNLQSVAQNVLDSGGRMSVCPLYAFNRIWQNEGYTLDARPFYKTEAKTISDEAYAKLLEWGDVRNSDPRPLLPDLFLYFDVDSDTEPLFRAVFNSRGH